MRAVVSGADGFIGSHLIPALEKEGWDIVGLVEPRQGREVDGTRVRSVDIAAGTGLDRAFRGADVAVHLAARNHVLKESSSNPLAEYRKVNVDGTRNVIRAARDAGVGTFVHISSVKAMGEASDEVLDEESPCLPSTPYGISKLESEEVIRAVGEGRFRAVIVRLPMVYGPRNKGNLPRMIRWADKGLPFPLLQPENMRSMVYVGNVVAGIMAVLKNVREGVTTYILKDREDYSTRTLYCAICRELERKPRFVPIPAWVVRFGGMLSEDFRKLTGSFRVSSARIERDFGVSPLYSLEEGIARTVTWYRNTGHRH